jgi:hypothetical protein
MASHEHQRSGVPEERRKLSNQQMAALCRDAATVQGHDARPFLEVVATMLSALLFLLAVGAKGETATNAPASPAFKADWRWVKGAVFVPTTAVNEAQQWDEYDPAVNDRELHYASVYGLNCVRVYLHYLVYLKNKDTLLAHLEDFLTRADKYNLKTEFVFFDDCWNQPDTNMLSPDYKYPAPIYGVHNSRWIVSPGESVRKQYAENRDRLKAYVQDIVNAHKADRRVIFWETYNEPANKPETIQLLKDSIAWIHETGTKIPVTATARSFAGGPYSDFITWHEYGDYKYTGTPDSLCSECMNREGQDVPGIVEHFNGKTGFIMWELGIGRDNCRFAWHNNREHPRPDEPETPFHGIVYPDGHPWSVDDVRALLGADSFAKAPLFKVEYYKDPNFTTLAKTSVTPMIDFDLGTERGTGSPDASAGLPREDFSVRWTGVLFPANAGTYSFYAEGSGRVKILVGPDLVIDKDLAGGVEASKGVPLAASEPLVAKIEYIHHAGSPSLHVSWAGPDFARKLLTPVGNAGLH